MIFWKKSLAGLRALSIVGFGLMVSVPSFAADDADKVFNKLTSSLDNLGEDLFKIVSGPGAAIGVMAFVLITMMSMGKSGFSVILGTLLSGVCTWAFVPGIVWKMFGTA